MFTTIDSIHIVFQMLEQDTARAFQNIVRIEFHDFLMNNNNNNLRNYILEEFKNVR
ncbi:hypothetical protein DPMN_144633 [Dreissena polymorpha]|uniref:Uncharacterized protein n=1 Tax=Dreissena polymorpha TaxID=45954 RepID=A0A9D4F3J6_DREPO|nr:hypothetical protein DPMN_144633 [Dreissena polymorpha]